MPETFDAPVLPENSKTLPVEIGPVPAVQNERRDWVSEAARAVSEQIKANPIGTGGVALIGLIALNRKFPVLDELTDPAIGHHKECDEKRIGCSIHQGITRIRA